MQHIWIPDMHPRVSTLPASSARVCPCRAWSLVRVQDAWACILQAGVAGSLDAIDMQDQLGWKRRCPGSMFVVLSGVLYIYTVRACSEAVKTTFEFRRRCSSIDQCELCTEVLTSQFVRRWARPCVPPLSQLLYITIYNVILYVNYNTHLILYHIILCCMIV